MQLGVVFPQTEIGTDPAVIRDYAQAAEDLGYHHILAYDHVLGADPSSRPGWRPPYTYKDSFYEPFVLYGYLAGLTRKIGLVTGVVILPQRQTALVAKQAAVVDVLSGGRLRVGVGIGWNPVEYEALGEDFKNRGARSEEQVEVLRLLWTRELVTYEGKWHKITNAGINPLPVQRPIPIWFGGGSDRVLRRISRLGDGWLAPAESEENYRAKFEKLCSYAREIGRDPSTIGIEHRVSANKRPVEEWVKQAHRWKELGARYVSLNTMGAGLPSPAAHIDTIRRFKEAAGDS
jgi:probable F420-dependent oxidoreductase